jgi:glycosyltransferase involved in cell wall biosynthesis
MEKPVIVTDIPCNRSIVGESECAKYVSDADPHEFGEAIKYFHDRRKTLEKLRPSCRSIGEKYDWSNIAESLEEFLISIIGR